MILGVTLLFQKTNRTYIVGVLTSLCIETTSISFYNDVLEQATRISDHYNLKYIGINDIYKVTGKPAVGEVLGRILYNELKTLKDAETLASFDVWSLSKTDSNIRTCSLVYFCKDSYSKTFTITVLTLLNLEVNDIQKELEAMANSHSFLNKIKEVSAEKIIDIKFIGVEDIFKMDSKLNIFEISEGTFNTLKELQEEKMRENEINIKLNLIV